MKPFIYIHNIRLVEVAFFLLCSLLVSSCGGSKNVEPKVFTVTASAGDGGSISPGSISVQGGQSASFTVNANTGYSISNVTGCNGSLVGNIFTTGSITATCNVTANFSRNSYMVTAIANEGGRITPGSLSVLYEQTGQFSVVADENYRIAEVNGCGGNLIGELYTTAAINTACTVNASFVFVPIGGLNDTGINWCANTATHNLDCPVIDFEGQDGDVGRDAQARAGNLAKIGGGSAGFDYTKIGADGRVLPIQDVAWDANGTEAVGSQWSCVRDNVTGLIWEIKTNNGGLQDRYHSYSWYNPDIENNGGDAGTQNGGNCAGSACDIHAFLLAVNSQSLCGVSDWRLPTSLELMSLLHNGHDYALHYSNPKVDTDYFPNMPNTLSITYWSSSAMAQRSSSAWVVSFTTGDVEFNLKNEKRHVRLVRVGK